jgi:hypothetical protein
MPIKLAGLRALAATVVTVTALSALSTLSAVPAFAAASDGSTPSGASRPSGATATSDGNGPGYSASSRPEHVKRPGNYAEQNQGAAGSTGHTAQGAKSAPDEAASAAEYYKGEVTARDGLILRDRPTRSSRILGLKKYGATVNIFCSIRGEDVVGNDTWYLLTDGTWAWGAARYIRIIGAVPAAC